MEGTEPAGVGSSVGVATGHHLGLFHADGDGLGQSLAVSVDGCRLKRAVDLPADGKSKRRAGEAGSESRAAVTHSESTGRRFSPQSGGAPAVQESASPVGRGDRDATTWGPLVLTCGPDVRTVMVLQRPGASESSSDANSIGRSSGAFAQRLPP
jgi:hypothetical protein